MDRTMTRRTAVLAAAGVFGVMTVVAVGPALAAFPDDGVKTYTGCLVNGGNVNYLKEGDSPSQPCSSPKNVVKLSGGDITKVTVTGALTGGGVNGAVTIGLDPAKTVPSSCASGQVPKWSTSGVPAAWACGDDDDTTYSAGTGLDLTGTTFSVDPDAFLAGTGLSKSGTTFNVLPDAFTKKDQACASGAFATGSDTTGTFTCGTPSATLPGYHVVYGEKGFTKDEGRVGATLAQLPLGAGTWAITFQAENDSLDSSEQEWTCRIDGITATEGRIGVAGISFDSLQTTLDVSYGKGTLTADATLPVVCNAFNSNMYIVVTALQVQ